MKLLCPVLQAELERMTAEWYEFPEWFRKLAEQEDDAFAVESEESRP